MTEETGLPLVRWWDLPQPTEPAWAAAAGALARVVGVATEPDDVFTALTDACRVVVGWRLATVLFIDGDQGRVRRAWTSDPESYPTGGTKELGNSELARTVFTDGRATLLRDPADLARAFPDHELIASLGCGAAMNIPIRHRGVVLGSVNLLDAAGSYEEADTAKVGPLAQYVAATLRDVRA
jgi:hypothetical protein